MNNMYNLVSQLIIYKDETKNSILYELSSIFEKYYAEEYDKNTAVFNINTQINKLLLLSTEYAFDGNLWHNYIAYILATTENPFTLVSEKVGSHRGTVNEFVKDDLRIFQKLLSYDFGPIEEELGINSFSRIQDYTAVVKKENIYNKDVSIKVRELSEKLENTSGEDEMFDVVTRFYEEYGVGKYGLNRAFKISHEKDEDFIIPITSLDDVVLDDLVGYELQKEKLIQNTESFVNGKKANNVLLYGDAGTGKSTSIKAILNQYYPRGRRMIEIYKHESKYISKVISEVKNRNYKFILYMDDLSFEESESDYKYLKALIEGGVETNSDNILIYATSNRRHIIKETWNERTNTSSVEELYHSDTIREKLSLVDRFGLTIGYYKPSVKEYFEIVKTLAGRYPEIRLTDEQLEREANVWLRTHGAPSGRTAEQLINYLISCT